MLWQKQRAGGGGSRTIDVAVDASLSTQLEACGARLGAGQMIRHD